MAEPLNATFFAFKSRDRAVLLPATISIVAIVLGIVAVYVAVNWSTFAAFHALFLTAASSQTLSDEAAFAMMGRILGLIGTTLLFLFPLYLAVAAYEAACLRWMMRGEAPGLFGITLNVDTWRVYSVYWFWYFLSLVVSTAASILTFPLLLAFIGQMPRASADPLQMMMWQVQVQGPIMLLQLGLLAFLSVRFAPAAATSVLRRKFSFFEAWKVTRGRFLALLGSFALLWLILLVVYLFVAAISFGVGLGAVWPSLLEYFRNPSPESLGNYQRMFFSPRVLLAVAIGYAIMIPVGLAYYVLSFGINARAAMAALEEGKITSPTV